MKKKKLLKIIAFISALCLIAAIIVVSNAFIGNPITAYYANKAIKNYVAEKYAHLDLIVERARYNFIDTSYKAVAKSKTSIDTHFAIYYRDGRIRGDDYEDYVQNKLNTLIRLQAEYSRLATDILSRDMGTDNITARVQFEKDAANKLELDMPFDKNLPIGKEIEISVSLADNSLNALAKLLENAHNTLVKEDFRFTAYNISVEANGTVVTANNVTAPDIEGGHLLQLLEDAQKLGDTGNSSEGIRVFTKQP